MDSSDKILIERGGESVLKHTGIRRSEHIFKKKGILALAGVTVVTISISAYYLLMPAWVIASRADEGTRLIEGGVYQVTDDVLAGILHWKRP